MIDDKLYFIAIVIKRELQDEIIGFKEFVAREFGSKAALRSPPHITLHMPFRKRIKKEQMIISGLQKLSEGHNQFAINLNGFGCFKPRVIFVDVPLNDPLQTLQKSVVEFGRKVLKIDNANYKDKPFHPHITVAFRDLRKAKFATAWSYFREKGFEATYYVESVDLLRHNGKFWDVIHEAPLKNPNLDLKS